MALFIQISVTYCCPNTLLPIPILIWILILIRPWGYITISIQIQHWWFLHKQIPIPIQCWWFIQIQILTGLWVNSYHGADDFTDTDTTYRYRYQYRYCISVSGIGIRTTLMWSIIRWNSTDSKICVPLWMSPSLWGGPKFPKGGGGELQMFSQKPKCVGFFFWKDHLIL